MEHLGTRTLKTVRLLLRPFLVEDAPAMYANWASDPEVTRYLTWPTHSSVEVSRQVLGEWVSHYAEPAFYQWAIMLASLGEPVGSISVVSLREECATAHVGYCIGRRWWHQGITSEALEAVLAFLFEQVGANRVESCHDPRNPHSGMVMRHCGLQYEGTLRQAGHNNLGNCDIAVYGLLAQEYKR